MKVYIAGPMAGNIGNQDYRKKIKKILRKYDVEYICPLELDVVDLGEEETDRISEVGNNTTKHTEEDRRVIRNIMDRDKIAIDGCDMMIAYSPFPSYGTDMEAFYHSEINNKPLIVFSKTPKSWMIGLGDYFVYNYADLDRTIKKILNIVNGDVVNGKIKKNE